MISICRCVLRPVLFVLFIKLEFKPDKRDTWDKRIPVPLYRHFTFNLKLSVNTSLSHFSKSTNFLLAIAIDSTRHSSFFTFSTLPVTRLYINTANIFFISSCINGIKVKDSVKEVHIHVLYRNSFEFTEIHCCG